MSAPEPVVAAIAAAKPIDWLSVALAFTMPLLVAIEPYLNAKASVGLPPVGTALLIAAVGSLIAQLAAIQRNRAGSA